jgi:hypothetical protein
MRFLRNLLRRAFTPGKHADAVGKTINLADTLYRVGPAGNLQRVRSQADELHDTIARELARLAWPTQTFRIDLHPAKDPGKFHATARLGPYSGLSPTALHDLLRTLPHRCGYRHILDRIAAARAQAPAREGEAPAEPTSTTQPVNSVQPS